MHRAFVELANPIPLVCPCCGAGLDVTSRDMVPGCSVDLGRNVPVVASPATPCPECGRVLVVRIALAAWAEPVGLKLVG